MIEQIQLCEVPKMADVIQPDRPSRSEEYVRRAVAENLYLKVKPWLEAGNYPQDDPKEQLEVKETLFDVLHWSTGDDGYALAKKLDRDGWACDSELVNILDDAWYLESQVVSDLTKQWVEVYKIKSPFLVGDKVKITSKNNLKDKVGVVTKIYEDEAKCAVHTPEQPLTSSWRVEFEDLEPYVGTI